jgi:hypothetical protein
MGLFEYLVLLAVAFVAGAINAVAGGGSLISFPTLLAVGFASKTANVTNTVALWPGTVGGSVAYRSELVRQRRRLLILLGPAVSGAALGSLILLLTPGSAFDRIVPFLIFFACAVMAFQEQLSAFAQHHRLGSRDGDHVPLPLLGITFIGAIYGAYFGAGLGIIMLAFLSILLPDDIQHSNALKGMLAMIINAIGVLAFALFGPVRWGAAGVMAVGAISGGYLGVGVARRLGRRWLRWAVIAYGLTAAFILLLK